MAPNSLLVFDSATSLAVGTAALFAPVRSGMQRTFGWPDTLLDLVTRSYGLYGVLLSPMLARWILQVTRENRNGGAKDGGDAPRPLVFAAFAFNAACFAVGTSWLFKKREWMPDATWVGVLGLVGMAGGGLSFAVRVGRELFYE